MTDTVCLLFTPNWVIKTRQEYAYSEQTDAVAHGAAASELTARLGIWHPQKQWFIFREKEYFWLANVSPRLRMLAVPNGPFDTPWRRQPQRRFHLWRQQYGHALKCLLRFRLALDVNAWNFGEAANGRLYYVDDEVYDVEHIKTLLRSLRRLVIRRR